AREEHFHLLGGGVLGLVENDERMVQRAAAHVGERREFDRAALEELPGLVETQKVVERVVERAQVGIDLLSKISREEPKAFARLDRGPHQHDALHGIALQRVHRARDGEIGLAGARGTDRESDVVLEDILDVLSLPGRAAAQVRPPGEKRRVLLRSAAGGEGAIAAVTVTSTNCPTSCRGPRKLTTRLSAARPESSPASLREAPSTRMRWRVPIRLSLIPLACASIFPWSRASRARFTSCGVSSGSSAAGVPGRRL